MWKQNDVLVNKISIPSLITLYKPHLSKPCRIELPLAITVSPIDFLKTFDKNINNEADEIKIMFISDLKDTTFFHSMEQTKPMLCRKLVRKFFEEDFWAFDSSWLPKCFGNINI